METGTSGQSKQSRIETLLKAISGQKPNFKAIAKEVGTSVQYVYGIGYDLRSNGGLTRAKKKYAVTHPRSPCPRGYYTQQTKAWRKKNPERWNELKNKNYASSRKFAHHARQRYINEKEDRLILGEFGGIDRELGKLIHRSVRAIQSRRSVLKKKHGDRIRT